MSFDIDIVNPLSITKYYNGVDLWLEKVNMLTTLSNIIYTFFVDVMQFQDFKSTSNCYLFESIPNASDNNDSTKKIGLRLIVTMKKYYIKNAYQMDQIIQWLNLIINKDGFRQLAMNHNRDPNVEFPTTLDGNIFDNVYATPFHLMRLPNNLKVVKGACKKLLVPIIPMGQ